LLLVLVFDLEKNLASQVLAGNMVAVHLLSLLDALHRAGHPLANAGGPQVLERVKGIEPSS
jgi:hypothetical protein